MHNENSQLVETEKKLTGLLTNGSTSSCSRILPFYHYSSVDQPSLITQVPHTDLDFFLKECGELGNQSPHLKVHVKECEDLTFYTLKAVSHM